MENNRILLVEDDPNFGTVLKDYLSLNDYEVTLAKDGLEGLIMFKNDDFVDAFVSTPIQKNVQWIIGTDFRYGSYNQTYDSS